MEKIKDVFNKLKNISGAYLEDLPVGEDWYEARLEKCLACPNNTKNGAKLKTISSKIVEKTLVDEEFGQCALCGCPTERKSSRKQESCPDTPKQWEALEIKPSSKIGSITDLFSVKAVKGVKNIYTQGGTFVVEAFPTDSIVFVELDVNTIFKGKVLAIKPSCYCAKAVCNHTENPDEYRIKIRIDKGGEKVEDKVNFSTTFTREGVIGKASIINLQILVDFKII